MIQPDLAPLQPSLEDMEISGKRQPEAEWGVRGLRRQQQELLGLPESTRHPLAWKKEHAQARAPWQAAGRGLACLHPGQSQAEWEGPGQDCARGFLQRVFPGVPNHLVWVQTEEGQLSPPRKEETSGEQVLCWCDPLLFPLPSQPQAEQPGGWLRAATPRWAVLCPTGAEPLSLLGWHWCPAGAGGQWAKAASSRGAATSTVRQPLSLECP